jgi:isoleucyl-tRNA synthetase
VETGEGEQQERLILAEALVPKVLGDAAHTVVARHKGADLVGLSYVSPFSYATPEGGRAHEVVAADFVSLESGSGLVHLAPAFGEDDYRVCQELGMGFLQLLKPDGTFPPEVTDFAGRFCKEADKDIIRNLKARGLLFKQEVYRHDYPFCWRKMSDPLIQYARRGWFIRTTQEIHRVQDNNQQVNWEPSHIKDGRFGQFLAGNVDWALSRERFWGTPLPVWINDETGAMECGASVDAILAKNPRAFDHFAAAREADPTLQEHLMVHKPWIDQVTWQKPGEPGTYRRVPEVIDCWFDSGCMPFAQLGYPHHNQAEFERTFPADFITEAVDQTRGWFYSLMTISTLLFPEKETPHPFRNCVVLGLLTDEHGKKYSKSLKNYTDPMVLMDRVGGDAVRWALYSATVPGQNTRFFDQAATDAVREFLLKIWNVYSFFVTYANIDAFEPGSAPPIAQRSELDRYILAELDSTVGKVRAELDAYKSHLAVRHLQSFVDALSNWYVRRSRDRFWAPEGEDPSDKLSAFATLYEVLLDLTKLVAPFTPFIAEEIYRNLTSARAGHAASVHLAAFPEPQAERADDELRASVDAVRNVVNLGSRVRNDAKLKVRQPLAEAIVVVADDAERARIDRFAADVREELNVKALHFTQEPAKYVEFELQPNFRVLGPKLGKRVPACKAVLAKANGSELHAKLERDGSITIDLDGEAVTLEASELEVRLRAKEGFAAASGGGHVVLIDTQITDALRREGLAREVVNRIQRVRKDRDLAYDARIDVTYSTDDADLGQALAEHAEGIARETLATRFVAGQVEPGDAKVDCDVDGVALALAIR